YRAAQARRLQSTTFRSSEHSEATGVKIIPSAPQLLQRFDLQLPTMTQVGRRLKATIISRVIVFCDFDRVFCAPKYLQLIQHSVIAMQQDETPGRCFLNNDLTEIRRRSQHSLETSLDRIWHW